MFANPSHPHNKTNKILLRLFGGVGGCVVYISLCCLYLSFFLVLCICHRLCSMSIFANPHPPTLKKPLLMFRYITKQATQTKRHMKQRRKLNKWKNYKRNFLNGVVVWGFCVFCVSLMSYMSYMSFLFTSLFFRLCRLSLYVDVCKHTNDTKNPQTNTTPLKHQRKSILRKFF